MHIIFTPYDKVNPVAGAKAQATKNFHDNPDAGIYTFTPNTGLSAAGEAAWMREAEHGKTWLQLWMDVCKKVQETGDKYCDGRRHWTRQHFVLYTLS